MKRRNNNLSFFYWIILPALIFMVSCNKQLEQFAPIPTPVYPTGNGVAATIAASPGDSLFYRLIVRSGLASTLNDLTKTYTLFATDNNGMRIFVNAASGGAVPLNAPDAVFSGFISSTLPAASAAGIIQYNTIGQNFPSSSLASTFPNFPLPSQIILDPTQPFVRLPIFPLIGNPYSYVNNIPVIAVDQAAANGVIHHTYTIVAPPSATLKSMIAAEPTLTYFRAAIARADSGSVGLNKLDSLLGYGVTNMTVLAPNDAAFQNLVYGLVYSQVFALTGDPSISNAQATGAVAAGPAFLSTNNVTTAEVKGILAYHFLASNTSGAYIPDKRIFSVDFPAAPGFFVKTLVNSSVAAHPGILVTATYTGPSVTSLQFTGLGTFPSGGVPYSGTAANTVKMDNHAVNGVYNIIDEVLLPQ